MSEQKTPPVVNESLTTQALKLALELLAVGTFHSPELQAKRTEVIIQGLEALAQPEQEPVAVYGYCPKCGGKGVQRERRPNGNDKCVNGHTYPSSETTNGGKEKK